MDALKVCLFSCRTYYSWFQLVKHFRIKDKIQLQKTQLQIMHNMILH